MPDEPDYWEWKRWIMANLTEHICKRCRQPFFDVVTYGPGWCRPCYVHTTQKRVGSLIRFK